MTDRPREVTERARYVERVADLPRAVAVSLAYAEKGYSTSGIAKREGMNESTARRHFKTIQEEVSPEALETKLPGEFARDAPVG